MLRAFIDESGHSSDPHCRFVGMGALVAADESWQRFEEAWSAALTEFIDGLPFHMKDFAHSVGPYVSWKEPRRRAFLKRLIDTIVQNDMRLVGCVVSMDGFSRLHPHHKQMFQDPYFIAFQQVTHGCAICGLSPADFRLGEEVHMVYAHQNEFGAINSGSADPHQQGRAEQLWHAMKQRGTLVAGWMGTYGSKLANDVAALQAADLFAYEITKEFENSVNRPTERMRWGLRQLIIEEKRQALIKFIGFEGLLDILMDDHLIDENTDIRLASAMLQLDVKMDMQSRYEHP